MYLIINKILFNLQSRNICEITFVSKYEIFHFVLFFTYEYLIYKIKRKIKKMKLSHRFSHIFLSCKLLSFGGGWVG